MSAWAELRQELQRLERSSPRVLMQWPTPDGDRSEDRFDIELAAHAEDVAADLYARFGDQVRLRVGWLPFPASTETAPPGAIPRASASDRPGSATLRLTVGLGESAGPVCIRSGFTERVSVHVTNRGASAAHLQTNGVLQTNVVDAEGTIVGGYAGAQNMPLVVFSVEPGETREIPALVGTASYASHLGYAVPPGRWGFVVALRLEPDVDPALGGTGVTVWSESLPLQVEADP